VFLLALAQLILMTTLQVGIFMLMGLCSEDHEVEVKKPAQGHRKDLKEGARQSGSSTHIFMATQYC
jgi:hypothetical protein